MYHAEQYLGRNILKILFLFTNPWFKQSQLPLKQTLLKSGNIIQTLFNQIFRFILGLKLNKN